MSTGTAPTVVRTQRPDPGVVEVVLAAGDRGNAIDLAWCDAFDDALATIGPDDRVVLVHAEGRNFCVGGDVATFVGDDPGAQVRTLADRVHDTIRRLDAVPLPVVVAVQGWAAGAGFSLALAGDLVVFGASARAKTAYRAIGLTGDGGLTWQLPRKVGHGTALDLLLSDRVLDADAALHLGVATRVAADADLLDAARELARTVAAGPRDAAIAVKQLVRAAPTSTLTDQLDAETDAIAAAADHPDGREGVAAFLERRPPRFGPG